jgi:hypothetical protein
MQKITQENGPSEAISQIPTVSKSYVLPKIIQFIIMPEDRQATVSAKVPKGLKDELERKGVKMSDAIRRGLERELRDLRVKELEASLKNVDLSKVSDERIVRDIRETREER